MVDFEQDLPDTPLSIRIKLAHAYFQRLADQHGIDILHVKGYAFGSDTYDVHRNSTDVDLLVRPSQVQQFKQLLIASGWKVIAHFNSGSIFEHASTLYHPCWGLTDVHRFFPGLDGRSPQYAFDQLWEQRRYKSIAHYDCAVPSLDDSLLLVVVHGARSTADTNPDIEHLKKVLGQDDWERLRTRAHQLRAEVAFDTALGRLEDHRGHPDYLIWKAVSQNVPIYTQWWARFRRARGPRAKLLLLWQIVTVNEDHLAMTLGHEPTHSEKRRVFFRRFEKLKAAQIFRRKI